MNKGLKKAKRSWSIADRLLSKAKLSDSGCLQWLGSKTTAGYGDLRIEKRHHYAHRLAFELFIGPIPQGLAIDHLCRNRGCINPSHLQAVTQRENNIRGNAPLMDKYREYESSGKCRAGHSRAEFWTKTGMCGECNRLGLYGGRPRSLTKGSHDGVV